MDRELIERLVTEYRESLIYFILRYVKDIDLAEDLAEDVFVELILHPNRFREESKMKTYLYAIGRNKAVDYIRKHSREQLVTDDSVEFQNMEAPDVLGEILESETSEELKKALEDLKEEYRTAIYLTYFEEMSYMEAAKVMKKSVKQVENYVYRGKNVLRDRLKGVRNEE